MVPARGAQWLVVLTLAGCIYPDRQPAGGSFGAAERSPFAAPTAPVAAPSPSGSRSLVDLAPDRGADAADAVAPDDAAAAAGAPADAALVELGAAGATRPTPADAVSPIASVDERTATLPAPVPPSAGDVRATERDLRNAFAAAVDPSDAALQLASFLVHQERYPEALHICDLALERKRSVPVRLARAGLLRDVARNDLAAVELRDVVRELGRERVSAGTLLELAQVEWLAGQRDEAGATMRDLLRIHADSPVLEERAESIREWHRRIE
ncbi:MAG: hypothetical protein KAI24_22325, partial [Planctomycetes bacterium]|nr:hypothetical protein [Planctomycetota bacterium]